MQGRNCPKCKKRWYSANENQIWKCDDCGAEIPVPEVGRRVWVRPHVKGDPEKLEQSVYDLSGV